MCTLGLLCVHRRNAICRDLGLQGVRIFIPAVWHCDGLQRNFVHTLCSTSAVFSRHGSQLVPSYRAMFIAGSSRLQWVPSEQWLGVYGLCQLDSNQRLSTTRRHVNCLICIVSKHLIVAFFGCYNYYLQSSYPADVHVYYAGMTFLPCDAAMLVQSWQS